MVAVGGIWQLEYDLQNDIIRGEGRYGHGVQ